LKEVRRVVVPRRSSSRAIFKKTGNGRLTTVETLENTAQGTPKTIQRYDYDPVGHVKRHRQTIGTNEYQLEYGYNLAGELVSEKYPSGPRRQYDGR
jgi:hypothetical protein